MTLEGPGLPVGREGWAGLSVVVHGFSAAGAAVADNLLFLGAGVTALDEQTYDADVAERAELLRSLGAQIRLGPGEAATLPQDVDLLISTGQGEEAEGALEAQADARGIPVWSDAEVAWRLRDAGAPPWLVAAGDSDRELATPTSIARLAAAIARSAGLQAIHAGTAGTPLAEAVMDPEQPAVLCVALSARQLARSSSIAAESAVVVGHTPALAAAYERVRVACVYVDDITERFVMDAEVEEGARAVGLTLATPSVAMLGVVDDILVDRAFIAARQTSAAELATLADLGPHADHPSYVRSALAAAALTRAHGLSQQAVRDGLREQGRPVDSRDDE